jgi:hypothetical protein
MTDEKDEFAFIYLPAMGYERPKDDGSLRDYVARDDVFSRHWVIARLQRSRGDPLPKADSKQRSCLNSLAHANRIETPNTRRKNCLVMRDQNQAFGLRLCNQHAVKRIFMRQRQTPRLLCMKGRNRERLKA